MTEKAYLGVWLEAAARLRIEGLSDAELKAALHCPDDEFAKLADAVAKRVDEILSAKEG